jgi:hypothetical protein
VSPEVGVLTENPEIRISSYYDTALGLARAEA